MVDTITLQKIQSVTIDKPKISERGLVLQQKEAIFFILVANDFIPLPKVNAFLY